MAEEKGCPLCQFIEAGPCKKRHLCSLTGQAAHHALRRKPHEEWVSCRESAKEQNKDYVTECSETVSACMTWCHA
eukprot:1153596-Pelagomonas_calceolata.AAC.4